MQQTKRRRQTIASTLSVFLTGVVLFSAPGIAAIPQPLHNTSKLNTFKQVDAQKLTGVRVAIADYELIKKDFPETQNLSETQIDSWLINKAGYILAPQTRQTEVNTQINVAALAASPVERKVLLPRFYNRAFVIPVSDHSFIDIKGVGSMSPKQQSHGNGLMTTGEALREYFYEKKVEQVLKHAKSEFNTVGSYAVFDFDFDVIHNDGSHSPAGAILRQAHQRMTDDYVMKNGNHFLGESDALNLELTLHRYGISSSFEGLGRTWGERGLKRDVINLQGNNQKEIVDFGTFRVRSKYEMDTYWYPSRTSVWSKPLLATSDSRFEQPDPSLQISEEAWGRPSSISGARKEDSIAEDTREIAAAFHGGTATRADLESLFLEKMRDGMFLRKTAASCQDIFSF